MAEKILIVDDDLDTLRLAGLMLQKQGFAIAAAGNGRQALLMAKSEQPDLILLDMMMPDMDGVEVTRRLRADEETRDIPIIMFTAKTQVQDKLQGFEAGVDDYLTKPTQPRELLAHVKAVLARTAKDRTSAPAAVPAPSAQLGYSLGVLAARGGLGVSTLALNLGIALRTQSNQDVIVADFRPGQGTLSMELGFQQADGLTSLLQMKPAELTSLAVERQLQPHPSGVRFLLSSPQPRDAQYQTALPQFAALARHLPTLAQYVVCDLGVAINPVVEKVIPHMNELLLVVEPVPQNITQSKAMISDLLAFGLGEGRLSIALVNRVRSGLQLSWSQVQDQLGRSVAVIFTPAPELAYQATLANKPMVLQQPESLTAQQFNKLAERVISKA
jgi:DNA-binding response OmpR family regulator